MHSVLMIAYFFPPLGGVGCQRVVKFARYLPQFGWRPIVLTADKSPYPLRDPELMAELVPKPVIFRALTVEPEQLYQLYQRVLSRAPRGKGGAAGTSVPDKESKPSLAARLQSWFFIPDARIGWLPFALVRGKQAILQERPAVIWSTSAPYTVHMIAKRLANWSGLPWIMDLRDPWVDNHFDTPPTNWHRRLTVRLEHSCVHKASRVVCVTPLMTQEMQHRYPDQPADKFVTITNGFDAADLNQIYPDPHSFSIRHIGTLYAGRSVLPFLRGLEMALQREPDMKKHLCVEFLGDMDRLNRCNWDSFINEHALELWVSRRPFVPRKQAIKMMQQTQVQVLILGKGHGIDRIYPAKVFEYLGAQRPILAIACPGGTATLVKELEAGIVADPDQPASVAEAILEFYGRFRRGELQNWTTKGTQAYDRRYLTGRLAALLDEMVAER